MSEMNILGDGDIIVAKRLPSKGYCGFRKAHTWQNKLKNFLPPVIANAFKNKYYIVT